ncbi:hypothetical protein [Winslowiella arboricola]|uniref:hypothetical protein n=1 Tax=Winslowiella arboricola TaxID=2978220 RepID=UPI00225E311E|nr:hypothetical protein [Winslowiella arboricola]MCU5773014.1 hypothetical protein [Winslowiella arboricola]
MSKELNINDSDIEGREITDLNTAIEIYSAIVESEHEHGELFYEGKIDEQVWVNTVYRVMAFPSYDVNWSKINMSAELTKKLYEWEFNKRKTPTI